MQKIIDTQILDRIIYKCCTDSEFILTFNNKTIIEPVVLKKELKTINLYIKNFIYSTNFYNKIKNHVDSFADFYIDNQIIKTNIVGRIYYNVQTYTEHRIINQPLYPNIKIKNQFIKNLIKL